MLNETKSVSGGKPKFFFRPRRTPTLRVGAIFILFLIFSFFFLPITNSPIHQFTNEVHAALSCTSCHGYPPAYPSVLPGKANSHLKHGTNCPDCHIQVTTAAYTITFATNHVNGTYDVTPSLGYLYAASGSSCTAPGCHGATYWGGPSLKCPDCHKVAVKKDATFTGRRAIVADCTTTANWGHFRANYGLTTIVTSTDCAVCHMEGKLTGDVGGVDTAYHMESTTSVPLGKFAGMIQLRDPDTGVTIQFSSWNGRVAGVGGSTWTTGSYRDWSVSTTGALYKVEAGSFSFVKFSRSTATAALEPWVTSVQNNHCLKCHDANGAATAVPSGQQSTSPFTGSGFRVDVDSHFATTNASYHPIKGPQNNPFCDVDTCTAPWNAVTKSTWGTSGWGQLISCWDCHIDTSPAIPRPWTHGGGKTSLRAANLNYNVTTDVCAPGPNPLCTSCHLAAVYGGATQVTPVKSAFLCSAGESHITGHFARTSMRCGSCHGSSWLDPGRRIRAEDAHGFNLIYSSASATTGIPTGSPTLGSYVDGGIRPFCFLRNTANKDTVTPYYWTGWRPRNVGGTGYIPGCFFRGSDTTTACDNAQHTVAPGTWEPYNAAGYGGWYSNVTPPP